MTGGTNHHPGNKRYRREVEDRKVDYVNSKRLDKPLIALDIIKKWRSQTPPGRFLKQDVKTGLFHDVGDKKAREKTSQALREKAPLIRAQQEEDEHNDHAAAFQQQQQQYSKETRFADGTKQQDAADSNNSKPLLARDHSLGREYLTHEDAVVTLEGFSWQEPLQQQHSFDRQSSGSAQQHPSNGVPSPSQGLAQRYPSYGSYGIPVPAMPIDPRQYSGRFESWSSLHGPMPPPYANAGPPPQGMVWTATPTYSTGMPPPASPGSSREHSLGQFPLPYASIGQVAVPPPFDMRFASSGQWSYYGPPPGVAPPVAYPSQPVTRSTGSNPNSPSTDPKYSVDIKIASAWSGQKESDIRKSLSGEETERESASSLSPNSRRVMKTVPSHQPLSPPKPDIAKRMTSHQCETDETKPDLVGPSVKRAALNRDSSHASNRLKELAFPGQFSNGKFDTVKEMNELSEDMFRSTLESVNNHRESNRDHSETSAILELPPLDDSAPKRLTYEERKSTIDMIAMDLMDKPVRLSATERSSTIEALNLDFDTDYFSKPGLMSRSTTIEAVEAAFDLKDDKPATLTLEGRMTTDEIADMVNDPIEEDDEDFLRSRVPIG